MEEKERRVLDLAKALFLFKRSLEHLREARQSICVMKQYSGCVLPFYSADDYVYRIANSDELGAIAKAIDDAIAKVKEMHDRIEKELKKAALELMIEQRVAEALANVSAEIEESMERGV